MRRHSKTATASFLTITSSLLMASCSGSGGGSSEAIIVGSCNTTATGFCVDYGADYKGLTLEKLCKSQKGEYSAGACPVEGRAGSCLVNKGKKTAAIYRYYPAFPGYGVSLGDGVAAAAQEQCEKSIKGEWTAG